MPYKDREDRLAYQRRWYRDNAARVIARVAARKRTVYAGVCQNCGGPTVGNTKGAASTWCGKPECRSAQRKGKYFARR